MERKVLVKGQNPKSAMHEIFVKAEQKPVWETEQFNKGQIPPLFISRCKVSSNGELLEAEGFGKTKKLAERKASENMLELLGFVEEDLQSPPPSVANAAEGTAEGASSGDLQQLTVEEKKGDESPQNNGVLGDLQQLTVEEKKADESLQNNRVTVSSGESSPECEEDLLGNVADEIPCMPEPEGAEKLLVTEFKTTEYMNAPVLRLEKTVMNMNTRLTWSFESVRLFNDDGPAEIMAMIELNLPGGNQLNMTETTFHGTGDSLELAKYKAAKGALDFLKVVLRIEPPEESE